MAPPRDRHPYRSDRRPISAAAGTTARAIVAASANTTTKSAPLTPAMFARGGTALSTMSARSAHHGDGSMRFQRKSTSSASGFTSRRITSADLVAGHRGASIQARTTANAPPSARLRVHHTKKKVDTATRPRCRRRSRRKYRRLVALPTGLKMARDQEVPVSAKGAGALRWGQPHRRCA